MCRPHCDNFRQLEVVTGNKLKKRATYILDTTHYWMMSKSPNSQDFADNGLSLGELCKRWQTVNKTHITCGYTKELPKESTNLGSDTNLYYQMGNSPDCSTQMEGFGTKTGSRCGIPKQENSQRCSHQDQECLKAIQESGKDHQHHSLNKKSVNIQEVYFFGLGSKNYPYIYLNVNPRK